MYYGWSLKEVMRLPARAFFALRKAAAEIKDMERYSFYHEMCRVMPCASAQADYVKELEEYYFHKMNPEIARKQKQIYDISTKAGADMANIKLSSMLGGGR